MITTDIHLHSSFSGDSDEDMEKIINEALQRKMTHLCFTEHNDLDFPPAKKEPENVFLLDTDSYWTRFKQMKEKFSDKITLLFGVEWGLQPHLADALKSYVNQYSFDFVIGSEHTTNRKDPYYPEFYEGRSEYEAYAEYFEDIIANLDALENSKTNQGVKENLIDTFGHLDYVVRYGPNKNSEYSYSKYGDLIDEILKRLIERGIALEVNAGGYKYNLGEPNPAVSVIRRYRELKGEMITVGSDAHKADMLQYSFDKIHTLLLSEGFNYHTIFSGRKPIYLKL